MHTGLLAPILGPAVGGTTVYALVLLSTGAIVEYAGAGALLVLDAATGHMKTAAAGTALVYDKTGGYIRQARAGEIVIGP